MLLSCGCLLRFVKINFIWSNKKDIILYYQKKTSSLVEKKTVKERKWKKTVNEEKEKNYRKENRNWRKTATKTRYWKKSIKRIRSSVHRVAECVSVYEKIRFESFETSSFERVHRRRYDNLSWNGSRPSIKGYTPYIFSVDFFWLFLL